MSILVMAEFSHARGRLVARGAVASLGGTPQKLPSAGRSSASGSERRHAACDDGPATPLTDLSRRGTLFRRSGASGRGALSRPDANAPHDRSHPQLARLLL